MKQLINTFLICITILVSIGIITYGIVINEIYETPYEQCLKTCDYSERIICVKVCTEELGKVINDFVEQVSPVFDNYLKELAKCEK